jgi:hypothetical protein
MRKRVWLLTVLVCSLAALPAGLAAYLWIMTAFSFKAKDRRRAADWYPGQAYLDYIGADAYNWHNCRPGTSNPWNSLEQLANPMRLFAQGKTIQGIMIPEWGLHRGPGPAQPQGPVDQRRPRPVQAARLGRLQGGPVLQQDLQVPQLPLVRRLQPAVADRLLGHGQRRLLHQGRTVT